MDKNGDNRLFLGGLPKETTELDLYSLFGGYGELVDTKVVTDRVTGESKGYGFLTFAKEEDAERMLKRRSVTVGGAVVRMKRAFRKTMGQFVEDREGSKSSESVASPPPTQNTSSANTSVESEVSVSAKSTESKKSPGIIMVQLMPTAFYPQVRYIRDD